MAATGAHNQAGPLNHISQGAGQRPMVRLLGARPAEGGCGSLTIAVTPAEARQSWTDAGCSNNPACLRSAGLCAATVPARSLPALPVACCRLQCKTRPMEKRFREISRREVADIYERSVRPRQNRMGTAADPWNAKAGYAEVLQRSALHRGPQRKRLSQLLRLTAAAPARPPQDVPGAVPHHIFHEVVRMNYIGLAASNARAVFLLTDGELAALPFVRHDRCVSVCKCACELEPGDSSCPWPAVHDNCCLKGASMFLALASCACYVLLQRHAAP